MEHFAKYVKAADGVILKDGHTMFAADTVMDLNRKSHLEQEVLSLRAQLAAGRTAYVELTNNGRHTDCGFVYVVDQALLCKFDAAFEGRNVALDAELIRTADEFSAIPLSADTMKPFTKAKAKVVEVARSRSRITNGGNNLKK